MLYLKSYLFLFAIGGVAFLAYKAFNPGAAWESLLYIAIAAAAPPAILFLLGKIVNVQ